MFTSPLISSLFTPCFAAAPEGPPELLIWLGSILGIGDDCLLLAGDSAGQALQDAALAIACL